MFESPSNLDHILDLRGMTKRASKAAIKSLLNSSKDSIAQKIMIRIDHPVPGSSHNQFQPIAKELLEYLKNGILTSCRPISPDSGLGFVVRTRGHSASL
jgi:hypothetical protein